MSETVPVHLEKYDSDADLDVDYSGEYPVVQNHDDLKTTAVVTALKREDVEEWDMDVVTEDDPMWQDEFADLELGDEVELT